MYKMASEVRYKDDELPMMELSPIKSSKLLDLGPDDREDSASAKMNIKCNYNPNPHTQDWIFLSKQKLKILSIEKSP